MKKATKKVIQLKEKEPALQTKWEVMVPCGYEESKIVEILADGYFVTSEEFMIFWVGESYVDGKTIAIFSEWIYVLKKP